MFTAPRLKAFRQGLHELGYIEDQNIELEHRYAEGDIERLPRLAADLVSSQVDVLVTGGAVPTRVAQSVTTTIPIVMVAVPDPIADGFIASLTRPGGNITGLSSLEAGLSGKRLELLKQASPTAARVAVIWNPATLGATQRWRETQAAADVLGVQLVSVNAQGLVDIEDLLEMATHEPVHSLMVWSFTLTHTHAARIVEFVRQSRLPTVYDQRVFVDAGGLMSYGAEIEQTYRRAAYYVDRILKGAKPADLPVEQPMTFELVVNLKTARELGITFPREIQLQITEVIE